jgi:hypothetical protein
MFPTILARNKDGYVWLCSTRARIVNSWEMLTTVLRFLGVFWKCARMGERLSPYMSLCCVAMAVRDFHPPPQCKFTVTEQYADLPFCRQLIGSLASFPSASQKDNDMDLRVVFGRWLMWLEGSSFESRNFACFLRWREPLALCPAVWNALGLERTAASLDLDILPITGGG